MHKTRLLFASHIYSARTHGRAVVLTHAHTLTRTHNLSMLAAIRTTRQGTPALARDKTGLYRLKRDLSHAEGQGYRDTMRLQER